MSLLSILSLVLFLALPVLIFLMVQEARRRRQLEDHQAHLEEIVKRAKPGVQEVNPELAHTVGADFDDWEDNRLSVQKMMNFFGEKLSDNHIFINFTSSSSYLHVIEGIAAYFDELIYHIPASVNGMTAFSLIEGRKGSDAAFFKINYRVLPDTMIVSDFEIDAKYRLPVKNRSIMIEQVGNQEEAAKEEGVALYTPIISVVQIVYPGNEESRVKAAHLREILDQFGVEVKNSSGQFTIYEPEVSVAHESVQWYRTSVKKRIEYPFNDEASSAIMDLHYGPLTIRAGKKSGKVPMSKAYMYMAQILLAGGNVAIGSSPGTGKSFLMWNLMANLSGNEEVDVYHVSVGLLAGDAWRIFRQNLNRHSTRRKLLFIDQFEAADGAVMTELLDLMEGGSHRLSQVSVCFVYNGAKTQFPSAMFRPGRVMDVNINPQPIGAAKDLLRHLQKQAAVEGTNYTADFDELKRLADAKEHEVGHVTLAQVYSCLVTPDVRKMLSEKLNTTKK